MKVNDYLGKVLKIEIDRPLEANILNMDLYTQLIMVMFQIQLVEMAKN